MPLVGSRSSQQDSVLDVDGNELVEPLTDGLLLLRYQFGLRGQPLIEGAVGNGATRAGLIPAAHRFRSARHAAPPGDS